MIKAKNQDYICDNAQQLNQTHLFSPIHLFTSKHKRAAFTLAEVLITLGIIGVIAAITIPSLIQSYKKHVYSTQLKKTYNTLLNAFKLSEADNGDMKNWIIPDLGQMDKGLVTNREFFDTYIKPYITSVYVQYLGSPKADIKVYLNDGSSLLFHPGAAYDIVMDINGDKGPNLGGRDVFTTFIVVNQFSDLNKFTKDEYKSKCKQYSGKNVDGGGYCFSFLRLNDFEFSDDYPLKL